MKPVKKTNYWFKCNNCGLEFFEDKFKKYAKCACGKKAGLKRICDVQTDRPTGCRTVYSRALAIDPSQVEEAKKLWPDENYVYNPKEQICMLEIKGAKQQALYARRHGMVDYSK